MFPTFFSSIKRILLGFNESNFHARNFSFDNHQPGNWPRFSSRFFPPRKTYSSRGNFLIFFCLLLIFLLQVGTDGRTDGKVGGMIIDSIYRLGVTLSRRLLRRDESLKRDTKRERSKWMCEYCKRNFKTSFDIN